MIYSPVSISFSGSGFLATYQLGVVQALLENAPWILRHAPRVYGASAGSLVAAAVACGADIGTREELLVLTRGYGLGFPQFSRLDGALRRTLPKNAHRLAHGRLHVSMTRIPDGHNVLASEFHSTEDLIRVRRDTLSETPTITCDSVIRVNHSIDPAGM
uniref:PNPLA domain-containing protein n=1 Tax=Astyanax mexicanus TaxID=7994 RepID=A0A8B9GVD9_ASTMX